MTVPNASEDFRVLLVDDDEEILASLKRILRRDVNVTTAVGPGEAILALRDDGPFQLVVSDMRMPGMEGLNSMTHMRGEFPDVIRIMLTGEADIRHVVHALNDELIFRFLLKPCAPGTLLHAIAAGRKQSELLRAERELLEQTWRGTVVALLDVLALVQPVAFGRGDRLARMVETWATELQLPNAWIVDTACRVAQLGSVGVPFALLERVESGATLTKTELAELARIPSIAERILAKIPRLESLRAVLRDISAPPSAKALGAAIIRLAIELDLLITSGLQPDAALAIVAAQTPTFPVELIRVAAQHFARTTPRTLIRDIKLADVRLGMIFAAEVRSPHGLLLAARGQAVTASIIERVARQWHAFATDQNVRVELPS